MNLLHPAMSNALKRGRSEPSVKSKLADIPPLHGDIILQIFTHKSLDFPGSSQKVFGDNARLAELGQQALELAVTHTLFHLKHPMLAKEEIAVRCLHSSITPLLMSPWVRIDAQRRPAGRREYRVLGQFIQLKGKSTMPSRSFTFIGYRRGSCV